MPLLPKDGKLIPDTIKTEVKVIPPKGVEQLLEDMHNDRQMIGLGMLALIAAFVWRAIRPEQK